MAEATLKAVAKLAGVSPVTVSRVVNGAGNVAAATRERVLASIRDLDYAPNVHAMLLGRKRSQENRSADSGAGGLAGVLRSAQEPLRISSEGRRDLARHIIQLRKDLDRLRRNAERIETCVEIIQQVRTR
jgi:transcriptional regulator with XRE-family HTH domain